MRYRAGVAHRVSSAVTGLEWPTGLAVPLQGLEWLTGLAVPLQGWSGPKGSQCRYRAWSGPQGSSKLRFPDLVTTAQDGGKVVSLTHRPPLTPGNAPGTHFYYRLSRPQGHSAIGRILCQ